MPIRWYALAYVAGIVLGWRYAVMLARRTSLWTPRNAAVSGPQIDDLVLWVTLGIIGGGRLGYVLFYRPDLFGQIFTGSSFGERLEILQLWNGGMSFHGGLIGVAVALFLFARSQKINPLSLGDLIAPVRAHRPVLRPHRQLHQRRAVGPPDRWPAGRRVLQRQHPASSTAIAPPGSNRATPASFMRPRSKACSCSSSCAVAVWKWRLLAKPGYVTGIFLLGYGLSAGGAGDRARARHPHAELPAGHVTMGMLLSIPMMLIGAWLIWRAWSRPPAQG